MMKRSRTSDKQLKQDIDRQITEHINAAKTVYTLIPKIKQLCPLIEEALTNGKKIMLIGNGGSAADCQHIAAEFIGRFKSERQSYPAIALTTDTSVLTALANDYSFDTVFSRQVEGLGKRWDILFGISTSGNSTNIISAIKAAKRRNIFTVGLLGKDGGKLKDLVDLPIIVPVQNIARIQECHILIGHIICDIVENNLKTKLF